MDEILLFLSIIPFIGVFFKRIHNWYHERKKHLCHHQPCTDTHIDHTVEDDFRNDSLQNYEVVTLDLVSDRFGEQVLKDLISYGWNPPLSCQLEDIEWRLYLSGNLEAFINGRTFIYYKSSALDDSFEWYENL
jgi:hypothetical protein